MLDSLSFQNKTIVITGGAGYIGMHTALELLKGGAKVVVVDDFSTSTKENYERLRDMYLDELELEDVDVCDTLNLRVALSHYTPIFCVIHFAGYKSVGESVRVPLKYYKNNILSTISLLEVMKELEVKNLIFSSSASVYGVPKSLPITEDHPCDPQSPYGKTKYFIEEILRDVANVNIDFNIVILRYFNPVGSDPSGYIKEKPKGIPENLMPYLVGVVHGTFSHLNVYGDDYDTRDGTGVRDYIHIVDLASGHLAAMSIFLKSRLRETLKPGSKGTLNHQKNLHIYNLGTGIGYSVLEMVKAVEAVSGKKVHIQFAPRRPGDVPLCYADTTKAFEELGWKAKYGINEMCRHSL